MSEFTPPGGEPPPPDPRPPEPWRGGYSPYPATSSSETTSQQLIRAERSRKMAGWALGLSFVWCLHPFTLLPSVGLAIAALARSGEGRGPSEHGRGMAISALVINGLWVALVVGLIVTGGLRGFLDEEDQPGNEPRSTSPARVGEEVLPARLREGDCFLEPNLEGLGPTEQFEARTVEVVPCKMPHDAEVYHAFYLPGDEFPGRRQVDRQALTCAQRFKGFVGVPYLRSDLEFVYYFPTEQSWDYLDDRGIICSVYDPERKTSGSLRNSRR